jgi:hypothetical protein
MSICIYGHVYIRKGLHQGGNVDGKSIDIYDTSVFGAPTIYLFVYRYLSMGI